MGDDTAGQDGGGPGMNRGTGPLDGLRVLDLTTMISGGFTTVMLADFGAEVISVEHPEYQDPVRDWEPRSDGTSFYWKSIARNKRHITLNLSTPDGQALARALADDVDLVVENFRPGTLERWDLGYDRLAERNSGLVLVRLSGYGQTGPLADRPGFGTIAESRSTFAHINGFPDGPPLLPPIPLADLTAAMFAIQGAMFALYHREVNGGDGQVVDVSLYEPLFRLMLGDVEAYDVTDHVPTRTGNTSPQAAPRNLYETKDGYIALSASSQNIFENVMDAIGRPELVDDPRFRTNADRVANREELDTIIEAWTQERTSEDALSQMDAADAIVGPVYDIADALADDQYQARANAVEVDDPDLGTVHTHGVVPKFSATPGQVTRLGAPPGADNDAVYREELGLDSGDLERLRNQGVI